ncbi:gamma-glutamylcyclotransferase [Subdoligranulum sp. AM23-21AC]|uniref:gamma-glutamylcyclotransferase family protein n=1 Tax=Ruthenibacterium lactatiformans TaxID=1550024 RepID=UPI000E3F69A1|nr:gamma-glutamylcyclotransferase family protein [Ruthenibacterium lactatiformans]RGD18621.1 gamma-glutamylcyclotransferase [Subdoligranulum sp. AM23-21AC]RJW24052.1 gamma-glutamylcyclotransferase [Subdoligranulum sp. TF05-17AC]
MSEKLYFAYGSNMNLEQMEFRCPDAETVGVVRADNYRLTFCGNGGYAGVATILPQPGSFVEGILWRISATDEKHLDFYEGYPRLYGKEPIEVTDSSGHKATVMAYTMNAPYRESPAPPSQWYLQGIVDGCRQNGIDPTPICVEAKRLQRESESRLAHANPKKKKADRAER